MYNILESSGDRRTPRFNAFLKWLHEPRGEQESISALEKLANLCYNLEIELTEKSKRLDDYSWKEAADNHWLQGSW